MMAPRDSEFSDMNQNDITETASAPEGRAAAPERRKPRRKKVILPVFLLAIIGAAGWFGYEWWTVGRFTVSTDDAYVAADFSIIAPKISGYVSEVVVTENEAVKAGEPLIRLEADDYKVALRVAEATVAARRSAIGQISSQIAQGKAAIARTEAGVAAAVAMFGQAELDLARYQELSRSDFASRQKLEAAEAMRANNFAELAARRADVAEANAALEVAIASRAVAEAELASAIAQKDQAARNLADTVITAPFDGVIGNLAAVEGEYVQPGARLLALVPMERVYIDANFKETQLRELTSGAPVHVEVDAWPDRSFTGHIEAFAPATGSVFSLLPPENATGNFTKVVQRVPVRISVPEEVAKAGWLRPGLSVVISADSRDAERAAKE